MPQVKTIAEEQAAKELAEFGRLETYTDRYTYFHAHPSLARVYCKSNFSHPPTPASPKPEPAPVSVKPAAP